MQDNRSGNEEIHVFIGELLIGSGCKRVEDLFSRPLLVILASDQGPVTSSLDGNHSKALSASVVNRWSTKWINHPSDKIY